MLVPVLEWVWVVVLTTMEVVVGLKLNLRTSLLHLVVCKSVLKRWKRSNDFNNSASRKLKQRKLTLRVIRMKNMLRTSSLKKLWLTIHTT